MKYKRNNIDSGGIKLTPPSLKKLSKKELLLVAIEHDIKIPKDCVDREEILKILLKNLDSHFINNS